MPELLTFLLGLHVPKAFSLYYLLLGLLSWRSRGASLSGFWLRLSVVLLLAFGISYSVISVHFGLQHLVGRDMFDLISMMVLPAAGVWVGALVSARSTWLSFGRVCLAYGLGALAYTWVVLLHGRGLSFLILARRFPTIAVPWGSVPFMNVRSVEQNAALAVTWFFPGLWLLLRDRQRFVGGLLLAASMIGLGAAFCFHGRLGYVMIVVGALPLLWLLRRSHWLRHVVVGSCLVAASGILLRPHWFDDERFDRFRGFMDAAPLFPWGGNQLHFSRHMPFDARGGELMHNVLLDIYVQVGWLPALLLCIAITPLLFFSLQALSKALGQSEQRLGALLAGSMLLGLTVQWLFQPLLFSDGLLFYFGFLLLGFLAAKSHEHQP